MSQESVTDGRTDRRTDGGNDNIPELSFESAGIINLRVKLFLEKSVYGRQKVHSYMQPTQVQLS